MNYLTSCDECGRQYSGIKYWPLHCVCGNRVGAESRKTQNTIGTVAYKSPGTNLKKLIAWFPVPRKTGCPSCRSLELKMNRWGPEKCRAKMPYILGKLKIAAKRRGLPFSERLVKILVQRAIDG
jgi:hypothetical protein